MVEKDLVDLLSWYENLSKVELEDIIEFHYRFECIHPFGNGNGRVGRAIMFKECLKNSIEPFIILDKDKSFYLRGRREYKNTIKNEQDIFAEVCKELLNFELSE